MTCLGSLAWRTETATRLHHGHGRRPRQAGEHATDSLFEQAHNATETTQQTGRQALWRWLATHPTSNNFSARCNPRMHGSQRCMLAQREQQKHQRVPLVTPFAFFLFHEKESTVTLVTQTKLPALKPHADCRPTLDGPMALADRTW